MTRRIQVALFVALLVVFVAILAGNRDRAPELGAVLFANEKFEPLAVPDPALRLDMIERLRKQEYTGTHRNIFSASAPPKPAPVLPPAQVGPSAPPPPPPLQVPVKFYGIVTEPAAGGLRRAFFTDGENIFILREGETLQERFRLLRIGNDTAEFEEIASGRRATLPLEKPPSQ